MKTYWGVLLLAVVTLALLGGCGGHGAQVPPGGAVASFVGRAVCATCHAEIHAAYGSYNGEPFVPGTTDPSHVYANFVGSAHGQDMRSKGPGNRNVQDSVGCQPCHTVGWQEPTGFTTTVDTPYLEGIGCEECHGMGSIHASTPSESNINRVPVAEETCWDCHNDVYKVLDSPVAPVDDSTWYNTNPGSIGPHYRQALFLLGYKGYNRPVTPSPHADVENTCVTCHLNADSPDKHGEDALKPDFVACVACHGSVAEVEQKLEDLDEEINDLLIELAGESSPGVPNTSPTGGLMGAYVVANGIVLTSNDQKDLQVVKNYKGARNNFYLVEGGCFVHNPDFARQLLEDAKDLVSP
jgi:hypothetical protein